MTTRLLGWHWLAADNRLGYGDRRLVVPGETLRVGPPISLCHSGLHASVDIMDALGNAPGPVISRVVLSGEIHEGDDKACATERTALWLFDATKVLHRFALWSAEFAIGAAMETGYEPDPRTLAVLEVKARWIRGDATDEELAAWSAAESAAWSAARSAAWSAAWSAAESAAWSAAESAVRSAAWSAAESAARSAAESAAWSAAWSAAESAARSAAWSAAESAARSAAWSAVRSAAESAAAATLEAMILDEAHRLGVWVADPVLDAVDDRSAA